MKKIVSVALAVLILTCTVFSLVSCGAIDGGVYSATGYDEVKVSGSKFVIADEDGNVVTYKYEVEGDTITTTYESFEPHEELNEWATISVEAGAKIVAIALSGSFEKIDDGFKINGIKFTKK